MRRDGRVLFWLPAAITTTVIAGSWLLMPVMGVIGTGVAWLGAQTIAALGVLLVQARNAYTAPNQADQCQQQWERTPVA